MTDFQRNMYELCVVVAIAGAIHLAISWADLYAERKNRDEAIRWWVEDQYHTTIPEGYARHIGALYNNTDVVVDTVNIFDEGGN